MASCLLAGCASTSRPFSYYHPGFKAPNPVLLEQKVAEIEKKDFGNIHIELLAQSAYASHHLVVIRNAETLHKHEHHDGWAMIIKGEGNFLLDGKTIKLYPGSAVFIPRGMPHQATRTGKEPLAAFVIFTPPFDGVDTIPVTE